MIRTGLLTILLVLVLCALIQHSNACGGGGGGGGGGGNEGGSKFRPGAPFRSSETSRKIAEKNYPDSKVEKYVATAFGDELPEMRDDLANRKKNGEGFVERHRNAFTDRKNWKVDPDNNRKETDDPARNPSP